MVWNTNGGTEEDVDEEEKRTIH